MKYLTLIGINIILLLFSCKKQESIKEKQSIPVPCNFETIKSQAGVYEMREYWDIYDSATPHHNVYDTVFFDFHIDYQKCNQLLIREKVFLFPFDSASKWSFINISKDPMWTVGKTLDLTHSDSVFFREEYGHLGRVFKYYVGRRK